eukprot:5951213-Lingulodinium_polyedra.AAC.1
MDFYATDTVYFTFTLLTGPPRCGLRWGGRPPVQPPPSAPSRLPRARACDVRPSQPLPARTEPGSGGSPA